MEKITEAQLRMIRFYFIELGSARNIPKDFMDWWDKQDWEDLKDKAKKLNKYEASCIISESVMGNYRRALTIWELYTSKK